MEKITEKTLIPLSLTVSLFSVFIGAIVYVTVAMAKIDTLKENDVKQDSKIEGQTALLLDIRDRIIRLESSQGRR